MQSNFSINIDRIISVLININNNTIFLMMLQYNKIKQIKQIIKYKTVNNTLDMIFIDKNIKISYSCIYIYKYTTI